MLNSRHNIASNLVLVIFGSQVACGSLKKDERAGKTTRASSEASPEASTDDLKGQDKDQAIAIDGEKDDPKAERTPAPDKDHTDDREPPVTDNPACAKAKSLQSMLLAIDCVAPRGPQFCSFTAGNAAPIVVETQGCFPYAPEERLAAKLCEQGIVVDAGFLEKDQDWKYKDARVQCYETVVTKFPALD